MNTAMERAPERGAAAPERRTMADVLQARRDKIETLAGKFLDTDRLLQLALLAYNGSEALQRCSAESMLRAVFDAARLGLDLDGTQAALIPFKGVATCMPMYRGLIKLAYEDPTVEAIEARAVREGDLFEVHYGTAPQVVHRPNLADVDTIADAIAYYAVAHIRGRATFEVMTRAEVEVIRRRSPSVKQQRSSPWDSDYDQMAAKTVLKRLMKKLPQRPRLRDAVVHDDDLAREDVVSTVVSSKASRDAAAIVGEDAARALPPPDVSNLTAAQVRAAMEMELDRIGVVGEAAREKEIATCNFGRAPASLGEARAALLVLQDIPKRAPSTLGGEQQPGDVQPRSEGEG